MKKKSDKNTDSDVYYQGGMLYAFEEISNYIDEAPDPSLKEDVDLEKEYDEQFFSDPVFSKLVNRNAGIVIARHFYKLGKIQNVQL